MWIIIITSVTQPVFKVAAPPAPHSTQLNGQSPIGGKAKRKLLSIDNFYLGTTDITNNNLFKTLVK